MNILYLSSLFLVVLLFQIQTTTTNANTLQFESNVKYTKNHEWTSLVDNIATIGISLQNTQGDAVYIELPQIGDKLQKGDKYAFLETVSEVSDYYMPLSGTITEVNKKVYDTPEILNNSPIDQCWLVKVRLDNKFEYQSIDLMTEAQYKEYLSTLY